MSDRIGQQLGNYRLLSPLGRGGFADVYLAEHVYLNTQAAIKVLQMRLTDEDKISFLVEARTIAHLKHTNIVRIMEYDVVDDIPFLIMEYAPFGTLRQRHPRGRVLAPSVIVPYVTQVAAALQYAHNQKLIHRDVKPENMLLGRNDTVLLSDFGLAVIVQSSRDRLQTVAGTVTYMAPEQLQGRPSPASDQYALAVIVYEWLSGERLFQGSFIEVASQHVLVPPPPLRQKNPSISAPLELVVQKALAKGPEQRFSSVAEFAAALEQVSTAASAVRPASNAPSPGTRHVTYRNHSGPVLCVAWSPDGKYIASASADRTVHVWNAIGKKRIAAYQEHSKLVSSVSWSPDGARIASGSWDTTVQVWQVQGARKLFTYRGFSREVSSVAWSPDGAYIAAASWDTSVQLRQAATGGRLYTYQGHTGPVYAVAWAPRGAHAEAERPLSSIASASGDPLNADVDNTVHVWDALSGERSYTYREHFFYVQAIAWSPDGTKIASASADTRVQVWDVASGHTLLTFRGHSARVNAVCWSPDGQVIASASDDRTVQIWDASSGHKFLTYRGHSKEVCALCWAPLGKKIASAGYDQSVQIWQAP
jgi:eukaryotic-like serine/threonine-protein kinase